MNWLHIIFPIVIGSVIGYCTNYIAIKMLFRPHKAMYIGKYQLPFTPGIIPKNQKRLAGAIGDAVSDQLLTKDAVLESVGDAGEKYLSDVLSGICYSEKSILEILPEEMDGEAAIGSVSAYLADSIVKQAGPEQINAAISKIGKDVMTSISSASPMLAMLITPDMQRMIGERMCTMVQTYLNTNGGELIEDAISSYLKDMGSKPIIELISGDENKAKLQAAVSDAFKGAAIKHGPDLLDRIDIRGIVSQRIEEMDVAELEELVLSVMKQELQAVINLGALIGAVIGILNIFL